MKQTILVTGGTGFIGSHTTVELIEAGYEVVIVDNLSNSKIEVLDGIEKITGVRPAFEQVDLRDKAATEVVFQKYPKIEGIIHFAASKAVGESVQKPLLYYRNNIVSLINLLELMPQYNVKGIIFSSSCTVYGQPKPENLPVTEEAPHQKATSPYGNTTEVLHHINAFAFEDVTNCVSRLRTALYPIESTIEIQIYGCRIGVRIVSTNLLSKFTITWCSYVSDNDAIESIVLTTAALQSDSCCHFKLIYF